jgi:hypothetical protein
MLLPDAGLLGQEHEELWVMRVHTLLKPPLSRLKWVDMSLTVPYALLRCVTATEPPLLTAGATPPAVPGAEGVLSDHSGVPAAAAAAAAAEMPLTT